MFTKAGKIRLDFYDNNKNYLKSKILYFGVIILLTKGGHGFEMLEDSKIIEVKKGPYTEDKDKIRFKPLEKIKNILECK